MPEREILLRLARCGSCGMLFLENTDYDLDQVHNIYWTRMAHNVTSEHSVEIGTLRRYLATRLDGYRTAGRLLEIGCGEGEFLKMARENGWETTGIEVSEAAAGVARKSGGQVHTGTLEQHLPGLSPGSFDVVVLWGVIEHVRDPARLLQMVRETTRKGGALLIYTPNANSIFHRLARIARMLTFGAARKLMECVIIAMHPMYFTSRTLGILLGNNGFTVSSVEMTDIDLDFVFQSHKQSWWSSGPMQFAARLLQVASRAMPIWRSHMVVLAKATRFTPEEKTGARCSAVSSRTSGR
jgi:2-polyprenyl-3-methyl-5-hydroxy-6-metoxy-1,4-benzoquinol methylase